MDDRMKMSIAGLSRDVVQKQYRASPADKKLLQCENLSPITQSALGQQTELRKGVDHDPRRLDALDLLRRELSGGRDFPKRDPVE